MRKWQASFKNYVYVHCTYSVQCTPNMYFFQTISYSTWSVLTNSRVNPKMYENIEERTQKNTSCLRKIFGKMINNLNRM